MQPEVSRFTRHEANQKVGRIVQSRVEFSGVPIGTIGEVIGTYEVHDGFFDVVIRWDLPSGKMTIQDRFAKSTYEKYLTEEVAVAA
jgi:hypothetical protein